MHEPGFDLDEDANFWNGQSFTNGSKSVTNICATIFVTNLQPIFFIDLFIDNNMRKLLCYKLIAFI